jgi:hypothetical protein
MLYLHGNFIFALTISAKTEIKIWQKYVYAVHLLHLHVISSSQAALFIVVLRLLKTSPKFV